MEKDQTGKNRKLSELKRDIVLIKLSSGQSVAAIAKELNIHAGHIHDYLRTYEGMERLEGSLRDAREILEHRLPSLTEKALDVLEATLNAPFMSTAKMQAAVTIVKTAARLSEQKKCKCDADRVVN